MGPAHPAVHTHFRREAIWNSRAITLNILHVKENNPVTDGELETLRVNASSSSSGSRPFSLGSSTFFAF